MNTIGRALLLVVVAVAGVTAQTVINGDFEQPLDVGWKESTYSMAGSYYFDRADTFDHATFAAKVYKYLAKFNSLSQVVDVVSPDVSVGLDLRLNIGGGSSTCWPVAAFIIRYQDDNGNDLGNTKLYKYSQYATWRNSDTAHLIDLNRSVGWERHVLDIRQELLTYLPGVNPDAVRKLKLDLYAYDNGT
jgi:hypothetical protein